MVAVVCQDSVNRRSPRSPRVARPLFLSPVQTAFLPRTGRYGQSDIESGNTPISISESYFALPVGLGNACTVTGCQDTGSRFIGDTGRMLSEAEECLWYNHALYPTVLGVSVYLECVVAQDLGVGRVRFSNCRKAGGWPIIPWCRKY